MEAGSEAAMKGIQAGSLIQGVNRKSVENVREFKEAIDGPLKRKR